MSRPRHRPHVFQGDTLRPLSCVVCGLLEEGGEHVRQPEPRAQEVEDTRRRMPTERRSLTNKVTIHSPEGEFGFYVTAGMYEDGSLGEIFIRDIGKEGSTIQGLLDAWALQFSISLQYGAPLAALVGKYTAMKFPPYGPTDDPDIPDCTSLVDYTVRWLGHEFSG